jgi:hypothetical protein
VIEIRCGTLLTVTENEAVRDWPCPSSTATRSVHGWLSPVRFAGAAHVVTWFAGLPKLPGADSVEQVAVHAYVSW